MHYSPCGNFLLLTCKHALFRYRNIFSCCLQACAIPLAESFYLLFESIRYSFAGIFFHFTYKRALFPCRDLFTCWLEVCAISLRGSIYLLITIMRFSLAGKFFPSKLWACAILRLGSFYQFIVGARCSLVGIFLLVYCSLTLLSGRDLFISLLQVPPRRGSLFAWSLFTYWFS